LAIPLMRQNFNIFTVKCQGKLTVLQQMSVLSFFEKMAGVAGFEPTDAEIKTRCLTTWRYPYLQIGRASYGERESNQRMRGRKHDDVQVGIHSYIYQSNDRITSS